MTPTPTTVSVINRKPEVAGWINPEFARKARRKETK